MSEIENGGSAFAYGNYRDGGDPGMTLRDYFAGQVAGGMAAHSGTEGLTGGPYEIAGRSYQIADAMLKARQEGNSNG